MKRKIVVICKKKDEDNMKRRGGKCVFFPAKSQVKLS